MALHMRIFDYREFYGLSDGRFLVNTRFRKRFNVSSETLCKNVLSDSLNIPCSAAEQVLVAELLTKCGVVAIYYR